MRKLLKSKSGIGTKRMQIPLGVQFFISMILLAVGAICLVYVMKEYHYFASGYDAWGHLFRSNLLYENISKGNYYPLFIDQWYNGIQPYRYWAPLPYYILATLQFFANGDILNTYYLFAGFSFFVGGMAWLFWGLSSKRIPLCTFLAFLWFFFPENTRVFFCEGNMPRMVTALLIPYLVYFVWLFVEKDKKWAACFITIFTSLIAISHLMISAMMGITAFLFLVIYAYENKKKLRSLEAIISMLLGYLLIGIWLVPALVGGLVSMDAESTTSVMRSLTFPILASLNPMNRINGVTDTFYFGISIIIISVFGIVFAKKKNRAGYYTSILVLLGTTPALVPILSKLPLGQLFWVMRFSTVAYAFFLWSFIEFKYARRFVVMILSFILLLDCVPSMNLARYNFQNGENSVNELQIAKEITNQRLALMDLSNLGSYPSWELCTGENAKKYTFGWAWQGAVTAHNIVMINTALEKGNYDYMFDRCVELGNDTIVVWKSTVTKANRTKEELLKAAETSKYDLYQETNEAYIFHFNAPESFAVQTEYKGISIGKYVDQIVFSYPTFIGASINIEDYSFEELSKYKTLYLSGFEYNNLDTAEKLVNDLAEAGVKIVIDMNHIPVNPKNKTMSFLGVIAQDIEFTSSYPTLTYKGEELFTKYFPEEYESWNTKYIEGASNVLGTANYYGKNLTFVGTNDNQNIVFLGFNLLFYCMQTNDQSAYHILNDCFDAKLYELPNRTIIPISITYQKNKIIIDSPIENVNTTIAYQDNFVSSDHILEQNNLLFVTQKHTEITIVYPYLKQGIILSIIGLLGIVLWEILILFFDRMKKKRLLGD